MGTLAYMAPEQGLEGTTGIHSDIYSLGIVLYEMLTGRPPFDGDTPLAILMKHVNDPLPLPSSIDPGIPAPYERVVLKALAKDPEDRYSTVGDMTSALEAAVVEVDTRLPERVPDPDFTTIHATPGVSVLSGDDRQSITDVPFVDDETDPDAGSGGLPLGRVQDEQASGSQASSEKASSEKASSEKALTGEVLETFSSGERVIATSATELKAPKVGFLGVAWRSILMMLLVIGGYNLTAVMLGLFSRNWRIYEVGWPAEIILVGLLLALHMEKTQAPWVMIPAGIILGNGILLSFYALTGWWGAWSFLWPVEPTLVLGSLGYALWLGAQKERKGELTERSGHYFVRIAVLALVIVAAVASLPLGGSG
jgi:hypothetical protein